MQLSITEETVKSRVVRISLTSSGANDRTHAVTIGLKRGVIDLVNHSKRVKTASSLSGVSTA